VVSVDTVGFVRGKSPGTTRLIVSAGGMQADTVALHVGFAEVDTLLVEDWASGLDESVWRIFGQPAPVVVAGVLPDGRPGLLSNGDFNYHSGLVSRRRFVVSPEGLTAEAEAFGSLFGDGQDWLLGTIADTGGIGIEIPGGYDEGVAIGGPAPSIGSPYWAGCGRGGDLTSSSLNSVVRRFAVQVRPDTVIECFADGVLLARGRFPRAKWRETMAIILRGRMENTQIYHGRVVVTRGLRY
jgi:hypothetical protein